MPATTLMQHVEDLIGAVESRDEERFGTALDGLAGAVPAAAPDEVQSALARLAPVLAGIPFGIGGVLVQVAGGMVEYGTDPAVLLPTLVGRAVDAMEQAARFEAAYRAAGFGDPPDSEDSEQVGLTLQRFVGSAGARGQAETDALDLVQAWFCAGQWVQPVLYLAQRKDIRAMLPERDRLTTAVEVVRERVPAAHWLAGLLQVVDDEPLIVLDRTTGRGFRVTISGIGDNFQLHTLLAAALIGPGSAAGLPGPAPNATEIAAATTGDDVAPAGGIRGNVQLTAADGGIIYNEGRPADIPELDGTRVLVLDPPPFPRTWNAGRAYPLMAPTVTVDGELPADEAARWLGLVKPPRR
jgi:hypothetical protein